MSFSFPELLFICEVFLEVRRKVCIFDWVWVITIGSLMGPMAFPANGSSYLGYSHLHRPRGQPNLLPHWSNLCQPCNLYLREMWESPDQPHIEDTWVVMRWCPGVQWCGEVWCGVLWCVVSRPPLSLSILSKMAPRLFPQSTQRACHTTVRVQDLKA